MKRPDVDRAIAYVRREGRPLDVARLDHHVLGGPAEPVARALAAFQNDDGGFRLLEMDVRTPESSAIATSIGLRILAHAGLGRGGVGGEIAGRAIAWLAERYEPARKGWRTVGPLVNDAPHAPWWEYDADRDATMAGSPANPTAEILGQLIRFGGPAELVERVRADVLALARDGIGEVHDFQCFLELLPALQGGDRAVVEAALRDAAPRLVSRDPASWSGYATKPLTLAPFAGGPASDVLADDVQRNLDWEVDAQQADGSWAPNWTWFDGRWPEDWEVARREWAGYLTVERLRTFRSYGRIASPGTTAPVPGSRASEARAVRAAQRRVRF